MRSSNRTHPSKTLYQIAQLGLLFDRVQLVHHLERHRNDGAWVVGQRRFSHQDQELAVLQTLAYLVGGLFPRKFAEEFFDVLDFKRAAFQRVCLIRYSKEFPSSSMLEHFPRAGGSLRQQGSVCRGMALAQQPSQ